MTNPRAPGSGRRTVTRVAVTLPELLGQLERRAAEAEAVGATPPVELATGGGRLSETGRTEGGCTMYEAVREEDAAG